MRFGHFGQAVRAALSEPEKLAEGSHRESGLGGRLPVLYHETSGSWLGHGHSKNHNFADICGGVCFLVLISDFVACIFIWFRNWMLLFLPLFTLCVYVII